MTRIRDNVVALTGAGSGIGRALAQALVERGAHVALADIDARGLSETAASLHGATTRVTTHVVDVSDRAAVEAFAKEVQLRHGGVGIAINNAGIGVRALFDSLEYEDLERVIAVNLWGVIHGTRAFLPLLREWTGGGHLVNIASINSMVPFAKGAAYNISKYAVHGLNETLMQDLRGENVRITSVHPGATRTNIVRNAKNAKPAEVAFFDRLGIPPARVAAQILKAVERNRERCFTGADAKLMALAKRLLPGITVRALGHLTRREIR
jgi:short-subunit dehydrogenase